MKATFTKAYGALTGATGSEIEIQLPPPAQPLPLRDRLAMAALTGILACFRDYSGASTKEGRCNKAYEYADEMLKVREKKGAA